MQRALLISMLVISALFYAQAASVELISTNGTTTTINDNDNMDDDLKVRVKRDVLKGSCVWGAVDYKSNCLKECKRMGYKGGHCGSFANVNCWCEQ